MATKLSEIIEREVRRDWIEAILDRPLIEELAIVKMFVEESKTVKDFFLINGQKL